MGVNLNLISDVLEKSVVSYKEIIGETLFVEENPARVEVVKVNKVNSVVTKIKETNEYKLIHKCLIIKDTDIDKVSDKVASSIDDLFIDSIDSDSVEENIEYFNKGILSLFKRQNPKIILDNIGNYNNWIVTGEAILKQLSRTSEFEVINSDKQSKIELRGVIGNISIFTKDNIPKNVIYVGDSTLTKSVFLKHINVVSNSNIYDIGVDFLFINKGIRKLVLE